MTHYVCSGDCGGESETPKVCDVEGCSKEGENLSVCACADGLHAGVVPPPDEPILEDTDEEE
ncbi:MAG TPA: hypothetical protein VI981_02435 [Candidatus Paceibacterota bacterium]